MAIRTPPVASPENSLTGLSDASNRASTASRSGTLSTETGSGVLSMVSGSAKARSPIRPPFSSNAMHGSTSPPASYRLTSRSPINS